jgi:hypothetical protein
MGDSEEYDEEDASNIEEFTFDDTSVDTEDPSPGDEVIGSTEGDE